MVREEACFMSPTVGPVSPWTLLTLASHLKITGNAVELIDCQLAGLGHSDLQFIIERRKPDEVVAVATLGTIIEDLEILRPYKGRKTAIIYPPCDPDDIRKLVPWIDSIVFDWLKHFEVKRIPAPDYDLVQVEKYYRVVSQSSVHCPMSCIFCTVANTGWKPRDPRSVVEEMSYLQQRGVSFIRFIDPEFTLSRNRVFELCRLYSDRGLKVKWAIDSRVSDVDETVITRLRASNCRLILYGVESGSQQTLDEIRKRTTVQQGLDAIRITRRSGIAASATFCFGFPCDSNESFLETLTFIRQANPTLFSVGFPRPQPNTELYTIARKENLLASQNLLEYQTQPSPIMRTRKLGTKEIEKLTSQLAKQARRRRYTLDYVLYRLRGGL